MVAHNWGLKVFNANKRINFSLFWFLTIMANFEIFLKANYEWTLSDVCVELIFCESIFAWR